MKPMQLIISGWGPYATLTQVDFSSFEHKGLFLITGPTGGGKTTIFDAISFALYGNVSGKNRDKTSVRSDFAKAEIDTFVELIFNHKGIRYRIRRSPKYARAKKRGEGFTISNETAELYVEEKPPIASVTEVNKELEMIMGINYDQFKQIAMIAQGEFLELLVANSKDRVEIFRNLFHTEDYEKLQRYLTDQSKKLYYSIENIRVRMQESIAALLVEGELELETLVEANDYQYEKIFELVKKLVGEEKKKIIVLEKQIEGKESEGKQLLSKVKDGEYQNQKIIRFQEVIRELEQLHVQKDNMELLRTSLKNADLAEKAAGEERIYNSLKDRLQQLQRAVESLERVKNEQIPLLREIEFQQKGNQQRLDELEKYKEQEIELNGVIPLLKELDEERKSLESSKILCQKVKQKVEEVGKVIETIKIEKQKLQEENKIYQTAETRIGEINLEVEKLLRSKEWLQKALNQFSMQQEEKKKLSLLHESYEKMEKQWKEKRDQYEEDEEIFKNAAVGFVALALEEGKPCPVCGSIEHPQIATISNDVPDEKKLKYLKEVCEKAEEQKNQIYEKTFIQKGLVDNIETEWEKVNLELGLNLNEKDNVEDELKKRIEQGNQLLGNLKKQNDQQISYLLRKEEIEKITKQLEEKNIISLEEKEQAVKEYQKTKSEYDRFLGIISQMEARLPKDRKNLSEVTAQLNEIRLQKEQLVNQINNIEEQYSKLKEQSQENQTLLTKEKEDVGNLFIEVGKEKEAFAQKLQSIGFVSWEEYHRAFLEEEEYLRRTDLIKSYESTLQTKNDQQKELEKEVGGKEEVDLVVLNQKFLQAEDEKKEIQKQKEELITRTLVNQKALSSMKEKWKEKVLLEEEYGIMKDLDDITKGNNPERVVFEHYVLSVYFEEVIRAANYRLSNMTGGRYELEKVTKVTDARTKDSLDLEVLDNYTGKKRSVKTLSGGESFKAALSLALGLSDIVQNNAGGIHIDTLFIDEGFGALDGESLDQALNTLMMLTEHNRLIGIISHVNELKERIDSQIIVEKSNNGSTLKVKSL